MESPAEQAKILLSIALPEEHDLLLDKYPSAEAATVGVGIIIRHRFDAPMVSLYSVLAHGMGTDAAYDAVEAAIERIGPDLVVCIGIAGALSKDLKVGDVVGSSEIIDVSQNMKISDRVVASKYDHSRRRKRTQPQTKTIIELSPKNISVATELSSSFRFLRSHPTLRGRLDQWAAVCNRRREELKEFFADANLVSELEKDQLAEVGAIISGPVVASQAFRETLKGIDRKVLAVETESAGVFRAASKHGIPCVTIRGISDHADLSKNALERTTKEQARKLAMVNALDYLNLQFQNASFMNVAIAHHDRPREPDLFGPSEFDPAALLSKVTADIDAYLNSMSPEYRHKPEKVDLPIPRLTRDLVDEYEELEGRLPRSIYSALKEHSRVFLKIPKSFPNQTLAWSAAQNLVRGELSGKQILPLVFSGDEIIPPGKGVEHATGVDPHNTLVRENFSPVLIVSEPDFHSHQKLKHLIAELKRYDVPTVVVSRSEYPTERIDHLKEQIGLVDFSTAPAPLQDVAAYLEAAFEMGAEQADAVAARLDETFSKFRLHTHPAYFVGIQETAIDALIQANHRSELIQLAVDGLLSFVVAMDPSAVRLRRTTREEFLSDLAFKIRVDGRSFSRTQLDQYVKQFADHKALEADSGQFLDGFFKVGLLAELDGAIQFSVPYLEAYLLAERLRSDPDAALAYFNPSRPEFDHFTFDLYIERGGSEEVARAVCDFSKTALALCEDNLNVYERKMVNPRVLANPHLLIHTAKQLSENVTTITERSNGDDVRAEKQRLIDTRHAVRGQVASRDPMKSEVIPDEHREEFKRLDDLSRASTLLATLVGSGAEKLSGSDKIEIANLAVRVFERFLHYWTINRQKIDFAGLREELEDDDRVKEIAGDLGIYSENVEEFRHDFMIFLDDQEIRLLSGPAYSLFSKIAQYAGVRSLLPIFSKIETENVIQRLFRDVWLMEVEHQSGKKSLKECLQAYRGSPLLRLAITTHLMSRVFWQHWRRESRDDFVEVARYSLRPLGLTPSNEFQSKMLEGKPR